MELRFNPGDRVRLTAGAVTFYGGAWPHFIPQGQGGGTTGTVVEAGDRPHKPGAAPRPYLVAWDNGVVNSYRDEDLEGLHEEPEEEDGTSDGDAPNLVPFRRG